MISLTVHIADGKTWNGKRFSYNMGAMGRIKAQDEPTFQFKIDYPLSNPKSVSITHDDGSGWTRQQMVNAIRTEYIKVYVEEEAAVGNPGHITGMLNRRTSSGPHGIWGHDIGDLVLEGITRLTDGSWELCVGS